MTISRGISVKGIGFCVMAAALGFGAGGAAAQEGLVLPQPVEQDAGEFSRPNREAIVQVRYTIKADGSTADVEVIDGFSNSLFDEAAVRTVEAWRFEPATVDGQPIDLFNQQHVLAFTRAQGSGISPAVREAYPEMAAQIQAGEGEAIAQRVEGMLAEDSSLLDYVFLSDLLGSAYMKLNMPHEALAAIRRATLRVGAVGNSPGEVSGDILSGELLENALRRRFLLAANLSQNVDAWATYERLQALGTVPEDDPVHDQAAAIRQRLDSSDPLGQLAKLNSDTFRYKPLHRILAVTEVDGQLDSLDIRCQRRTLQLEFQTGVEWNLPEVLGECEFEFHGDEGTAFTLYEFPQ